MVEVVNLKMVRTTDINETKSNSCKDLLLCNKIRQTVTFGLHFTGKPYVPAPYIPPIARSPSPQAKEAPVKGKGKDKGKAPTPEPVQDVVSNIAAIHCALDFLNFLTQRKPTIMEPPVFVFLGRRRSKGRRNY